MEQAQDIVTCEGQAETVTNTGQPNESREQLEALLATAVDGIVIIDKAGTVQVYSPACERLFGYSAEDVVGQNVKMLMPSPYFDQHDGYLAHYAATGEKRIIGIGREVVGRRKDETTFPMYLSVGEGSFNGEPMFVGIIHDITESREAEQALREREARLSSIFETIPEAIITIDAHGAIQSFSSAAERLFGYEADFVFGRNVSILMPPPYRDEHDGYLTRYLETGEKRVIGQGREVTGQRADGTTFPMELAVGEIIVDQTRLFTGFIRDLTERKQAERRVNELQSELLHVSRLSAMGQMASALAHELNQPLAANMNYVKAAKRTLENPLVEDKVLALDLLVKAGEQTARAGQIIRRLRDFLSKGHSAHFLEDINSVVEEALGLALVGAAVSNVNVTRSLQRGIGPVAMDKIQIQQVVVNLVRNAIEAMEGGDRSELRIATSVRPDGFACVEIADSGAGLASEVVEKLFEPFTTTKETGMGIGLSVCKSIIESHKGQIFAMPNEGGGTIFTFLLPVGGEKGNDEFE
tara:strand:- start:252817 stop:254391 length:1575 start_codon:yes stop_codon:yes gene_type:complete